MDMWALIAFSMLAQAAAPVDPLSQRMAAFCRSKPACIAKQKQGVRDFLDIITRQRPPQVTVQRCLARTTKKRTTDWAKAARCLRSATPRRRAKAR